MVLSSGFPAVVLIGPQLLQIYNDGYRLILAEKHPVALGQPTAECWPEVWHINAPVYDRVRAGETVTFQDALFPIIRHGALEDAWFTLSYSPLIDRDGTAADILVTVVETTDRVLARIALAESETRFRAFVTASSDAVYRMGPDWTEMRRLDGRGSLSDTTETDTNWLDRYIHADDWTTVRAAIDRAISTKTTFELEHRVIRADGSLGWTSSRAVPILNEEGHIAEWLGAASDVTGRKLAEEAQRESEDLRSIALTGGGMGTWRWDLGRRLVWGDDRFMALWGFPSSGDPLPLSLFTERQSLEGIAQTEGIVTKAIEAGEEFDASIEVVSGPNAGRWLRWRGRASANDPSLLYGVSFDITKQRQAELRLRAAEEQKAFTLKLSDALRPIEDPVDIQQIATRLLGAHLQASRVFYVVVESDGDTATILADYTDGVPSRVGIYSLSAFSTYAVGEWRAGGTASTDDVNIDPRFAASERKAYASVSTRAGFGIPLIKEGRLVALLGVNQSSPRRWTDYDIDAAREVAERTWAALERARAEAAQRASEEMLRGFGEASTDVLWIRDAETLDWTYLTPAFETIYGSAREEALAGDNFRNWVDLIVPDNRDRAQSIIGRVRAGERVTFEYRIRRSSDGAIRWLRHTDFPIRDATGQIRAIGGVGHDVSHEKEAERLIRASRRQLRTLVEGVPQLVWRGRDRGEWTWSSPQWTAYTGLSETASSGRGWLAALHPDDREQEVEAWRRVEATDEPLEVEYRIREARSDTYRWFQTRALPVRDEDTGSVIEWLGTSTDIDELRRLQEEQNVMVVELQHRTRNLIAVVTSIARQTMADTGPTEAFRAAFADRMQALSRVQGLLSQAGEERVTVRQILDLELAALAVGETGDRVRIGGPDVALRKSIVQTLSLAIHELATNALKYGALANDTGQLDVRWTLHDLKGGERWLALEWFESGIGVEISDGKAVTRGGGYGRKLIEKSLP